MSFVLGLLAAVFTTAAPARAQQKGAPRLVFSAPPGCGNEATFRHTVAIFFEGADPFDPDAPGVVRVTFTKIPGGYRGAVQYTPPRGDPWPAEETIGTLCSLLFRSVARVASMHVPDPPPKAAPAPIPSEPAPAEPAPPPRDPIPFKSPASWVPPPVAPLNLQAPQPSPSPPEANVDLAIGLSGIVLMTAGYADNVGAGFQIGAELRSAREESDLFRLGLEFRALVPSQATAREPVEPNVATFPRSFDLSQVSGLAVPCLRWRYLLGCGVVELAAAIRQDEIGLDSVFLVRVGPRIGVEVPFAERFAVRGFAEVLFSARPGPTGFSYEGGLVPGTPGRNVAWYTPVASGFFGVGLSVKFE